MESMQKENSVIILNANPKFTIQNDEKFKYLKENLKLIVPIK